MMKTIQLVHNPSAGDTEYDKAKLIDLIRNAGFSCRYSSTKESGWKSFEEDTDLIVIAGGDGTVRKVVKQILSRHILDRDIQLCILPLGTANNFAKTLGIGSQIESIGDVLKNGKTKSIDVGSIYHVEEEQFFIESFGYGIFPYLMQVMKKKDTGFASAEEELNAALKELHKIILDYDPAYCNLIIDGVDHSGKYILAEVMNTISIGPNLELAPNTDPGDGVFEVVLVPEGQKDQLAHYVSELINSQNKPYEFFRSQGKEITISWEGTHVHVDDKVVKLKSDTSVDIQMKHGILKFLVPND